MNSLILNGVSSDTITGLMIQEFAPISKPPMRVLIEEIDGRNGDIITDLGYQAYDKPVLIGLYGDFDINEVLAFFNSEGEVTFSNEPDFIYKYKIIDQIDMERLVRFRVGTVNFHVQPFKHKSESALTKTSSPATVTNNGNISSCPKLTITGSGTVNLSLNGNQIFVIDLSDIGNITIDTDRLEAYKDSVLMNRRVSGDYDAFQLNVGSNTISWTGTVTSIVIENYSRWI